MVTSKGMISVAGHTYRLVERSDVHVVVRVLDDQPVGTFRHQPELAIIESSIGALALRTVAQAALRAGKLRWSRNTNGGWLRSLGRAFLNGAEQMRQRASALLSTCFSAHWLLSPPRAVPVAATQGRSFVQRRKEA